MSVRVLVVDDSATMRELISAVLRQDPQIEVVGHAADPLEARTAIKQLNPDVITLDVEMPNMNGLEFLEKIMRLRPTPVIMVSSLTQAGASVTLRALECGAFDCVAKPSNGDYHDFDQLPEKVRAAAKSRMQPRSFAPAEPVTPDRNGRFAPDGRVVAIGSSTGGVEALIAVLSRFPANCPPVLITQHMPATFTKSFAERLNRLCAPEVAEAEDGMLVLPGHIYLAPGSAHLEIANPSRPRCRLHDGERVSGHRPSADVLFGSVARVIGARSLGVILTGMGRDGAQGLLEMRQAGAETIGQDEASCIVYGMPKVAFEIGAVSRQLSLGKMADHILRSTSLHHRERV
ncbi:MULTISPECIES: protein-glutamate methylesterase/protein-glutamine glutaminase [Acidiphilium]|uniref:Protein-glutamate methylesterase/protein-glutamine glutaminase n=1 Tax=Acidiphilium rubrum TaxID=526 RepID=A0A8G2FEI1_ACIRU|nr:MULTISPECIES: chemotaxis response regulator protein-glutamate methylesterase [Acidiphilium]MBW4035683.1 chemotaxis response regulator protein-glutamate methylesterase [Pseudomonadota bacterium]SIQ99112.1 two-component system, chemotaxis family, response regulator CheB [Acidiphilium rubrum]